MPDDDGGVDWLRFLLGLLIALGWALATLLFMFVPSLFVVLGSWSRLFRIWSWACFLSPAFYAFISVSFACVAAPLRGSWHVYRSTMDRVAFGLLSAFSTAVWTAGLTVAITLSVHVLAWGLFPLEVDKTGDIRLRLIPFIPWPSRPFWG